MAIVDPDQEMKERMPKVTQGQTFYAVAAEKTEHFTSPPKPYSEDTLLAAMETAGNKEFDEDTEKKGLGTPATTGKRENYYEHPGRNRSRRCLL